MDIAPTTHDAPPELTTHLDGWSLETQAEAKEAILGLTQHPGWDVLTEAIRLRGNDRNAFLKSRQKPFESPAEYEAILGEIRGLESIEAIVDGVIFVGTEAENELRSPG